MGRFRILISLVLALVFAVAGSSLIYKWMTGQESQSVVAKEQEKRQVMVAKVDLPWGTLLTPEKLKQKLYLKDNIPEGSFPELSKVEGRVLIAPVKRNEVILEGKLAPDSVTKGGVAAVVSKGKRAIAVKGNKVLGLAGFIQPGDRVDVLVTLKVPGAPDKEKDISKTVLEDILVLATGTQVEKKKGEEPAQVDVFTLEMAPEEAEKLALASTQGTLHFALRNVIDKDLVLTQGATVPETLDSFRSTLPASVQPLSPAGTKEVRSLAPKVIAVECIKGTKVTKMEF